MTIKNQQAQTIIEHTRQREENMKLKLLSESLGKVEKLCTEYGLSWFAMGKLLTLHISGEDSYPEEYRYDIGMLRQDYDAFMDLCEENMGRGELRVRKMYHSSGVLQRLTAYIVNRRKITQGEESLDIEIRLYIQPFDVLPSGKRERAGFVRAAAQKASDLHRLSSQYRFLRKDAGSLKANPLRIPRLIKDKLYLGYQLKKQKSEYETFISRYSGEDLPDYVGRIDHLVYPPFRYRDIFPLKKAALMEGSDIVIQVPAKPQKLAFLPAGEEKKRILSGRLGAVKLFNELCREKGISYVAMEDLAVACSHNEEEISDELLTAPWILGLMRKDYETALELLDARRKEARDIRILKSEPYCPFVCGEKTGFCLRGYEQSLPERGDGYIYLLPFDVLPLDYEEKLSYSRKIKEMADQFQKQLHYEKGTTHHRPLVNLESFRPGSGAMNSWQLYEQLHEEMALYNDKQTDFTQIFAVRGSRMLTMPYNEVFPSAETVFCGQTISCSYNPFFWNVKKDPAYTEYLAGRREEIMKLIDEISLENGIDYFAMSNLLIGAVIYHDVMPQSDQRNMDIGFLRKDFEAFVSLLRERAADYGIELHESLDGEGKYPLEVKYITKAGCKYSQARVRLLPFDKVPEDFYLYQGFRDDIDEKNEDYKQLLKVYNADLATVGRLPAAFDKEKKERLLKTRPAELAREIEELAQSFNDDERTDSYMWITFGKSKIITGRELFPLKRVKFRSMEVNCPRDTSVWQPVLDAELERQVSCIQKADLILLEEFDKVCKKLGTGYFVCGGTMLGYMRHEGFIPWDDDVDVAMLRADYDRFMKEAGPLLPDRFFLQTRETDPNIPYLFSKIRLDDTEYITKYNDKRKFHKGICLDIFPFDYLPEDKEERERFVKEVKDLAKAHHLIARRQFPVPEEECTPRNEQESRYIEEQKELLKSYWEKDLAVSQQAYLDAATRYNDRAQELKLRTVASFVPSYTFIDLNDLLPYQRGKFEDIEVSVPKRPDIFLSMQYGDFMKLPPKHMQVAHRLLRWSTWEASGEATTDDM